MNEKEFQAWNEARLEKIRDFKGRRCGPIDIEHGYRTTIASGSVQDSYGNYLEEGESRVVRLVEIYPPKDLVVSRHLAVARYFAKIHTFGSARRVTWLKNVRSRHDMTGIPLGPLRSVYTTQGYIPLHLAVYSEKLIELTLDLPDELRSGVELTLEQVEEYASGELKAYSFIASDLLRASDIVPMENGNIIVTRHPAFVTYLEKIGLVTKGTPVVENAAVDDVMGKDVYTTQGSLPPHIAVHAERVVEVDLDYQLPKELRSGVELSLEQVEEYASVFLQTFTVSATEPPDTPGYVPPELRERVEKARAEKEARRNALWARGI